MMTEKMTREELLKRIPIGKGSPNSTKYYFKLGPIAALRMDIIMADDDTDWDELWNEIEPELGRLLKDDDEFEKKERLTND